MDEFTVRYQAYLPVLTGLIRRLVKDAPIEIEDVLQDVWIHGCRGYTKLRDPAHFRSWIGRTAINAALMALRKTRRRAQETPIEDEGGHEFLASQKPQADESAERDELLAEIAAHARRQPELFAPLFLVRIVGMTHKEASCALGITEASSKSRDFRAMERLRASLTAPKAA